MTDHSKPPTTPDAHHELCYECGGRRVCQVCDGSGRLEGSGRCGQCNGRGRCFICNGAGQLPLGTSAAVTALSSARPAAPSTGGTLVPPTATRRATLVGRYTELGFDRAPSLVDFVRSGNESNRDRAVAYLKAGAVLILTISLLHDVFERGRTPGSRSILTDGTFAWPAGLAYYVERYGLPVPVELEEHMARNKWQFPAVVDLKGLGIIYE